MSSPWGLALDSGGNILVADYLNNVIRLVNASGTITTVVGDGVSGYRGDGGPAANAELYGPIGVAIDSNGDIFIADYGNSVVRRVDAATGIITTVAGNGVQGRGGDGGPATTAELGQPYGVALDRNGDLLIADTVNNAIRRVDRQTGIITTVAGNGMPGYSGDGGSPVEAELSFPTGVTTDRANRMLISDFSNNRVRRVDHRRCREEGEEESPETSGCETEFR